MKIRTLGGVLSAGAALVLVTTSVRADGYVPPQAKNCCDPWTGLNFGVAFGGGWTHLDVSGTGRSGLVGTAVTTFPGQPALTSSSLLVQDSTFTETGSGRKWGGAFSDLMLGYTARIAPSWIAGFQAEGGLAQMHFHARGTRTGSNTSVSTFFNSAGAITGSRTDTDAIRETPEFGIKLNWSSSVLGRLGFLVTPSTLLYGTAGLTYAGFEEEAANSFNTWGWSVGGGIEQKLGCAGCSNWSLRLEYRFTDFRERSMSIASSNTTTHTTVETMGGVVTSTSTSTSRSTEQGTRNFDPDMHTVRVGVVYTFR
jgi:opacity protein-like surface antigen